MLTDGQHLDTLLYEDTGGTEGTCKQPVIMSCLIYSLSDSDNTRTKELFIVNTFSQKSIITGKFTYAV